MAEGFTADGAMFEGLYVHALGVSGAFADELRAAGFDVRDIRRSYPVEVWVACLDLAARRLFPELDRFEAWRRLGHRFIVGYFDTMVGRLIAMALPLMGAERFVPRIPQYVRTGLGGSVTEVEVLGRHEATITLHGPHEGSAWVLSGVLEECFERLGRAATLVPEGLGGIESRIQLAWAADSDAAAPTPSERHGDLHQRG